MIDRKKFFDGIRHGPFDGKLSAKNVSGTNVILDEWERRGLTDLRWLAYMLATTKWETDHTMQPIIEGGSQKYLRSKKYWPWIGRGFVQLTWKNNYVKMTDLMRKENFTVKGVHPDLVAHPDLAMDPQVAAFVMFEGMIRGSFTGKKLGDYFNATTTDPKNARRIINGTDRAAEIASIYKQFYADLVPTTGAIA